MNEDRVSAWMLFIFGTRKFFAVALSCALPCRMFSITLGLYPLRGPQHPCSVWQCLQTLLNVACSVLGEKGGSSEITLRSEAALI